MFFPPQIRVLSIHLFSNQGSTFLVISTILLPCIVFLLATGTPFQTEGFRATLPSFAAFNPGNEECVLFENENDQMLLTSYGKSSGFVIDPIEKKPLNHFYPGTSVLSFGTAGCNLACDFCQNWDISKSREMDTLSSVAFPEQLAKACVDHNCHSIAFTYNDPVIFLEYALDTAIACREQGVKTVAITAGYITKEARRSFSRNRCRKR